MKLFNDILSVSLMNFFLIVTINENSEHQDKDSEVELRRSRREMTEKSFCPYFFTYVLEWKLQTFKEAMNAIEKSRVERDH